MMQRAPHVFPAILVGLLCAACTFDQPVDVLPEALTIRLTPTSGDGQTGIIGSSLANPFIVTVEDRNSDLVTDVTIDFVVTSGAGTLSTASALTDLLGQARTTLTLAAGINTVEARTTTSASSVTFTATGYLGSPNQLVRTSGNGQSGIAGLPLAEPYVVTVEDVNGNGVPGVDIDFVVTRGGGTLVATRVASDAEGRAHTTLTLGSAGENIVEARATGLPPVTLTAIGSIGAAAAITRTSPEGASGTAGSPLTQELVVTVEDANHNGVQAVAVQFAVTSGGGTVSDPNTFTDALGQARTTLVLGTTAGINSVEARATGVPGSVVLTATGVAGPATELTAVSGSGQTGLSGSQLSAPFIVSMFDANANPAAGVEVTFVVTAGGGTVSSPTAITDATGYAQTFLTLGPAGGTNTVEARVPGLSSATFSAVDMTGMCVVDGTARPIVKPVPGQLVITEFLANPAGTTDNLREWFEITNTGTAAFDMNGLTLKGVTTSSVVNTSVCMSIAPGGFALFARSNDPGQNGMLPTVDGTFPFALADTSGTLEVRDGTTVLDAITWSSVTSGISRQLNPTFFTTEANDAPSNFCGGTAPYGDGTNTGTPKAPNWCP